MEARQKVALIVAGLNPPVRNIIMKLSDWRTPDEPTAWGISPTNGIPLGDTSQDEIQDGGIFALTCRLNHSCKPMPITFGEPI